MVNNFTSSYPQSAAGFAGFTAWQAWRQDETYMFLALQAVSVLFALAISHRDSREREKEKQVVQGEDLVRGRRLGGLKGE